MLYVEIYVVFDVFCAFFMAESMNFTFLNLKNLKK